MLLLCIGRRRVGWRDCQVWFVSILCSRFCGVYKKIQLESLESTRSINCILEVSDPVPATFIGDFVKFVVNIPAEP